MLLRPYWPLLAFLANVALFCLANSTFASEQSPPVPSPSPPVIVEPAGQADNSQADNFQAATTTPQSSVTIADEPKFIDRGQFLPPPLVQSATVDLRDRTFQELIDWLRQDRGLTVVVDNSGWQEAGVLTGDAYSDWLTDAPVYFLLDRLRQYQLGWYVDQDILFITSARQVAIRQKSVAYAIGDLLDQDFSAESLCDLVQETIALGTWDRRNGNGRIDIIGDTLFILNSDETHLQVQGLLMALKTPGRQTFISDSRENYNIREMLDTVMNAEYRELPLVDILTDIGQRAHLEMRLDQPASKSKNIRGRKPITISVGQQSLRTILAIVLSEFQMGPIVKDGTLWIGSADQQRDDFQTATYDVRDLCRDVLESEALSAAIESQLPSSATFDEKSPRLEFARAGIMVVWASTDTHREILSLLQRYRTALVSSKRREPTPLSNELVTRFYRLDAGLAQELSQWIPQRISPETWQTSGSPQAVGTIEVVASIPDFSPLMTNGKPSETDTLKLERKTLVIRQHESIHDEIVIAIRRITRGDKAAERTREEARNSSGAGGGGFGGGLFTLPSRPHDK